MSLFDTKFLSLPPERTGAASMSGWNGIPSTLYTLGLHQIFNKLIHPQLPWVDVDKHQCMKWTKRRMKLPNEMMKAILSIQSFTRCLLCAISERRKMI